MKIIDLKNLKFGILIVFAIILLPYGCEKKDDDKLTFTDYDGNTYNTVKIGDQVWMAENLKTTHYPDGTEIQLLEPNSSYNSDMSYYDYSPANANIYGALYTWPAAKQACPSGWHLPSDEEWKQLEMSLGMSQTDADNQLYRGTNEGSKLAGNSDLWEDGVLENDSTFGTSGFNALPGGYQSKIGTFKYLGVRAFFWTATERDASIAWHRDLYYFYSKVYRYNNLNKMSRMSVRYVKDN